MNGLVNGRVESIGHMSPPLLPNLTTDFFELFFNLSGIAFSYIVILWSTYHKFADLHIIPLNVHIQNGRTNRTKVCHDILV